MISCQGLYRGLSNRVYILKTLKSARIYRQTKFQIRKGPFSRNFKGSSDSSHFFLKSMSERDGSDL